MKRLFYILLSLSFCCGLHAQDVIYVNPRIAGRPAPPGANRMTPRPGKEGRPLRITYPATATISGKVTEISPAYIFYHMDSDPQGNIYSTPISSIDSVVFASGRVQTFLKAERNRHVVPEYKLREREKYANLGTNIFTGGFGMFTHRIRFLANDNDPDFTPFVKTYLSYEKIFANDRLGFEVSPFIALNKKGYGSMFHAKFYPKNYGKFRVGLGPVYTAYLRDKEASYFDGSASISKTYQSVYSVLAFGVSMQMHVERNLFVNYGMSIGGVLGYSKDDANVPTNWQRNRDYDGMGQLEMRLGIGYRF